MSIENEDAIPYNRYIGLMKMSALVSPILGRLAAAEALLTDKMNRGELKESEARLLTFAKYMIEAETPVVGDFQTGLMIIDAIAADYGGGPDRGDEPAAPSPVMPVGASS